MELEKLGLRSESLPFDWVISDFEGVMLAIQENFVDFLKYEYLSQSKRNHAIYCNTKYNIKFYHDFDKYVSLKKQLPQIQEKYNRRILRFYNLITEPTLFIRYISAEDTIDGKTKELIYIENNYEHILEVIKSFNEDNDILFIANEGISSDKVDIYNVQKDENDVVARAPIHKNPILFEKFNSLDFPDRQKNLNRYLSEKKKKNSRYNRFKRKVIAIMKRLFVREYSHECQF